MKGKAAADTCSMVQVSGTHPAATTARPSSTCFHHRFPRARLLPAWAVCDPVMGDDGRLYVRPDIPAAFRDLIVPLVRQYSRQKQKWLCVPQGVLCRELAGGLWLAVDLAACPRLL